MFQSTLDYDTFSIDRSDSSECTISSNYKITGIKFLPKMKELDVDELKELFDEILELSDSCKNTYYNERPDINQHIYLGFD